MVKLENILKRRTLILDGATGTNLLDKGLAPGESPSILNIRNPDEVFRLHRQYIAAGSDIILTNTFTANPMNIPKTELDRVISVGVKIAKRAAKDRVLVFGDIGPLGELIEPYGEFTFDQVYNIFLNICRRMSKAGIKVFWLETFTSMVEAKAAFLAAREFSDDVFICLSLQDNGYTIMGESAETIAVTFQSLGAKGIGVNCTTPQVAIEAVAKMFRISNLPLIIKPNAGRIKIVGNKVHHTLSDREMARFFKRFVNAGSNIIGGCCGTSPKYIELLRKQRAVPKKRKAKDEFILTATDRIVRVTDDSLITVGERMNPSGRKRIKGKLIKGNYEIYGQEARAQEAAGVDALDVNAYVIELEENKTLKHAIFQVMKASNLPLFVDTQDFNAASSVLASYPGIGVYNSVPAQKKALVKWLPMIKKHGFKAVISLVGKTIPRSIEQRMANVAIALKVAKQVGFSKDDLIFDPLVFSAATDKNQIVHTLKTVEKLHKRGFKTILGISNVSFGLPQRTHLNAVLATAAVKSGTNFLILNPLDEIVMNAVRSTKLLFKRDFSAIDYTMLHSDSKTTMSAKNLSESIIIGDKEQSRAYAQDMLDAGTPPQDIIDKFVSKALKMVGDLYETGEYYIPDLLKAAEASKYALGVVRKYLPKGRRQGIVVLATVKGDIHDIGKNIAGMIFESAGYEVIDLGKDITTDKIVATVRKVKPDALGLSALLTTTMPEMAKVVRALKRAKLEVRVIIGGPNVSKRYAKEIGAYGAATTVLEGLSLLREKK
ncbi:MAG: homocysteine S-methyltransferase family protein [bacterium]